MMKTGPIALVCLLEQRAVKIQRAMQTVRKTIAKTNGERKQNLRNSASKIAVGDQAMFHQRIRPLLLWAHDNQWRHNTQQGVCISVYLLTAITG
jgi:hypothetical protein